MERARREGGETRRETKGRTERQREAGTKAGLLGKRREEGGTITKDNYPEICDCC
jgi:hypothetical protein